MKRLILTVILATSAWAAEEKAAPTMPSEVTLTSGRVLRNVQVLRWESNRVVLKHSAGADPISFALFKTPTPAELPAIKLASTAVLNKSAEAKKAAQAEAAAPKKYEGQVFIVTRGAGSYLLGATPLRIYFKARSEILDAYKWSSDAPRPDEIAVSDAEGRFSFMAPGTGPVTIVAKGKRLVGSNINHDYETYLWIVSVDEMPNRFQPLLSNGNMETGPIVQSKAYESL